MAFLSSRLCFRFFALHNVYNSSQYSHFISVTISPPLSFHSSDLQTGISHFQNALTQITSWITSNLLSLNSSKTEFLLIGLKQLLSKIHKSSTLIDTTKVGGVAQWLERRSFNWRTFLIFAWSMVDMWPLRGLSVHYGSTNQANSAYHPFVVGKWVVIHVITWISEVETI